MPGVAKYRQTCTNFGRCSRVADFLRLFSPTLLLQKFDNCFHSRQLARSPTCKNLVASLQLTYKQLYRNDASFSLGVGIAVWLYVRRIPLLRLPWILFRRVFKWEPIYARAKFMTCYLDVSYDITPLAGEPNIYGNPDVLVTDQIGNCSARYLRSANGFAAICKCEKKEQIILLDRGVIQNFFQVVNLINEGYVLGTCMRSLFPGVYLCSHVDVFTFLEAVADSGAFFSYQKEVHMILDREPLSMETPGYAKIFDTLPFIAQAKGYQVLSAILSALSLLGSFFTPLPWIALSLAARLLKHGFQRTMGLTRRTNGILLLLSTLIPLLRPLNTVTNKVSYIKSGVTFMRGGQSLPKGYTLVLSEIDAVSITAGQRLTYIFDNVSIEIEVSEIKENAVVVVDLVFTRDDEVHRYEKMCYNVEDFALTDVVMSNWMRCYEVPPLFTHKHIAGMYECTQPTTLFQVVGDGARKKSYHLVHMHHSLVE